MSDELSSRPPPPPDWTLAYGPLPSQYGELRLPAGPGPHPLAIVLHGGWWHSEMGLGYLGHLAAGLTRVGVATWNLEFRRLGATGGGWPMTFVDVAAGADQVCALAQRHALDLSRVITVGHSSGGHLALWLAARARVAADSPIHRPPAVNLKGALSIAGAVDLRMAQARCLRDGFVGRPAVEDLLGGTPAAVPDRYAAASPADLLPLGLPQVLIHGTADDIAPLDITESYRARAHARGDYVRLIEIAGADHFAAIDPQCSAFAQTRDAVKSLLNNHPNNEDHHD